MPRNDKQSGKLAKHGSSKHAAGDSIPYPTVWSEWERDDKYQRYRAYRLIAPGQYEYDYKDYNTASQTQASTGYQPAPETPYNYGTTSQSSTSSNIYASTVPTQSSSSYSSASQSQTASSLHLISESPPYTSTTGYTHKSSLEKVTNNMQSMSLGDEKEKDPPKTGTVIKTRYRHKNTELGPFGSPQYEVHHQNKFKAGSILILNWVEPSGSTKGKGSNRSENTFITREPGIGKDGSEQYQKVRRFLIVKAFKGHCLCLPINTYSFQGVNKNGVHADNHAVIYSEYPPKYLPGEKEKGLVRPAILMVPDTPANKLHPTSRLNYAKLYTIEYNVKVRFIGYVHGSSGHQVAASYNEIHQRMEPFPKTTNQAQSLGESSRSQQPTYGGTGSYLGSTQISTTNYGTGYSGSAPYASTVAPQSSSTDFGQTPTYGSSTPYSPYSQYNQETGYGQSTGAGQNFGYGSSSTQSSGVPRTSRQTNTPTYSSNYSLSSSNTQQPPYSTSQGQDLPSSSYPGGSGYQTNDYSNTGYPKREYGNRDDDYHNK